MRNSRHLARSCAVQALYQWQVTGQPPAEIESSFIRNQNLADRHLDYFQELIKWIPRHAPEIDRLLSCFLDRELERVDLIEHAILRVGAYELKYEADTPVNVIIDEAVGLARVFASEHGYKYVNGVLDKVAKEVRGHPRVDLS